MGQHQKKCQALQWNEQFQWLLKQMSMDIHLHTGATQQHLARYQSLIAIGAYLGLRAKELLHLRWIDVLEEGPRQVYEFKTGKQRTVFVNERLQKIIEANYRLIRPTNIYDFIAPARKEEQLAPISTRAFNKAFRNLCEQYEIRTANASSHTLRKTFAIRVFEKRGGDEQALWFVSELLGHASVAITRHYLGLQQQAIAHAYMTID